MKRRLTELLEEHQEELEDITKEELAEFLVEYFLKSKTLDLAWLDFRKYQCNVDISHMKVAGHLDQGRHLVTGGLDQYAQVVTGHLDQSVQVVTGYLDQSKQKVGEYLDQSNQYVRGKLYGHDGNTLHLQKEIERTRKLTLTELLWNHRKELADITKEELVRFLIMYFNKKEAVRGPLGLHLGNVIDLTELDFTKYDGSVNISRMNVGGNLYQNQQRVGGDLNQSNQHVTGYLYCFDGTPLHLPKEIEND